jgi:hypothetical protein
VELPKKDNPQDRDLFGSCKKKVREVDLVLEKFRRKLQNGNPRYQKIEIVF